ncbi:MAG: TonB-dependent receptor [Sphingobium sp.]|uniref:TonB-dependent receptor n=1 Tax=Sphingobium sp. TaxID=1912891 RepID=UPI0029B2FB7A|nr:TonB-dependent receptor [Sphingobium sp.]MDX3910092.1 TonB-dependent receptor [Sphingobium sp.]
MTVRFLLLATAASASLIAPGVHAQEQGAPVAPAEVEAAPTTTNAIIVTARRRAESAQDVPLAIAVLDAKTLESSGTFNVGRLTQLQPSIQFYSSNPRNSAANIRGLGAPFGLTNDGIEQGVGIYVDQVYYARSASSTFDFLDVEQIEILRGPQGTLYGKNTTAGAINITSRKPSFTPEGRAELTVGNLGLVQGKASISGPIIDDKLAVRLGTSVTKRKGAIHNVASGQDINDQDNLGFKAQFLLRATDNLNLTLSGDYSRQRPNGYGQYYVRVGSTQRAPGRQYAALAAASGNYQPPSLDPFDRVTDLDSDLDAKQDFGGVSLLAEWDIGPGTLTSVSAWRKWKWGPANDRDFIGLPITTVSQNPSQQEQWSQELRYASSGKNAIDYVFGLYAFHQTVDTQGLQVQGPLASRWLLSGTTRNAQGQNIPNQDVPEILNGLRSENDIGLKNTSLAAFGQLTWRVTDALRIQPGIRLNYDKKEGKYIAAVFDGQGNPVPATGGTAYNALQRGVLAPQSYSPKFSDWNLSYDLTLSYDIARDILAYATYARSFKSGGINLSGLPLDTSATGNNRPITEVATIKPEKVNHFEVGLKTQFLDHRATLNLAGFWTEIKDYQATVTNNQPGLIRGYLANAEKIRVRGIEADFSFRPSDRFTLYTNGAFTDHEYVSFPNAPCPPELAGGTTGTPIGAPGVPNTNSPATCNISGQWLPGISKWAFAYGAEYNVPAKLLGEQGEVYLAFDGSYRSKFSSNPSRSIYNDVSGYSLANFRLGFRTSDKWDLSGWVRNAFDEEYFELLQNQSGSTGLVVGQPADPRTYGVTLRASF